jgi:hypothetical protein
VKPLARGLPPLYPHSLCPLSPNEFVEPPPPNFLGMPLTTSTSPARPHKEHSALPVLTPNGSRWICNIPPPADGTADTNTQDADLRRQSRSYCTRERTHLKATPMNGLCQVAQKHKQRHTQHGSLYPVAQKHKQRHTQHSSLYPVALVRKTTRTQTKSEPAARYLFNVQHDNWKIWFTRRYPVLPPATAQNPSSHTVQTLCTEAATAFQTGDDHLVP